jgi:hypothetical protein
MYKDFFPRDDILRINHQESQKPPGQKRRPIYFGTIYVRDGRASAIVSIEGHDWSVSVHGTHINRAFSGDRVAVRLLPRGHWKVQLPDVLDLNDDSESAVDEPVGPLNVIVTFNGEEELSDQARSDTLGKLQQLLFDDGFLTACSASSQSGWYTYHTAFVTVNAGFVSKHDLSHKLASTKRKIVKPAGIHSIEIFIDKPHDAAAGPSLTLSSFSDDIVGSSSPKTPLIRCTYAGPRQCRAAVTLLCRAGSSDAVLTGGREGPRPGDKTKLPVGEVVHVYPRSPHMHLCGLVDRGAQGWGSGVVCLSSKPVYLLDRKHEQSFCSGLPDFANLSSPYEQERDGFVMVRLIGWEEHQQWPTVEVTHALCTLPHEHQFFICLAVSHGFDVRQPLASNPREMFPFDSDELVESANASRTPSDDGCVDMRHSAVVFTIDGPATVDLDDAMHCCRLDDGNYEVCVVWCLRLRFIPRASAHLGLSICFLGGNSHRRRLSFCSRGHAP